MHHGNLDPRSRGPSPARLFNILLPVWVLGAGIAAPASDAAENAAQDSRLVLDEVVVTATRRGAVDLKTTPVAATALTGGEVDALVPTNLGDISALVPNFAAGQPAGFNAASFAMRGVGQTAIIVHAESQVGVTVDDFVLPNIQTQLLDMFDIEQIEVLRGPQGTLFGKNTTGGAVNIRTKRPELGVTSAEVQARVGEYGRREGRFAVNVPVVDDQLALRAAGIRIKSDGYYRNGAEFGPVVAFTPDHPDIGATGQGDGSRIGGDDSWNGRVKLLWEPTPNLQALVQYEFLRDRGDTPPTVNTTPESPQLVFNNLGLGGYSGNPLNNAGVTNRDDVLMGMSSGHQIDVDGWYLNVDWDFGDYTFSSVTGVREQESELPSTYAGKTGPVSLFDANRLDDRKTFQHEMRVATHWGGPFDMVGGVFYQEDTTSFCVVQVLGFLDLLGVSDDAFGDPTFFDNNPQILCNKQDAKNYAVFADGTWNVNDRLSIGAGIRWTREEKDWIGRNQVFVQALGGGFDPSFTWEDLGDPMNAADFERFPDGVFEDDATWRELTWRGTVGYSFSDEVYGYLTYARGFKSGAYNDQTGTSGAPITERSAAPTDPEIADSFEAGVKLDLLDRRLRLDLTAFHVTYDDAQRDLVAEFENAFGGTFQETRFFNAAEVTAQGIEAEMTALLTERFTLRANLGYTNSSYDSFEADTNFDGNIDVDLSDRDVNRAPELQWGLDARYSLPLPHGTLDIAGNLSYEDESVFVYSNTAEEFDGMSDERTLLSASVTWRDPSDAWFVRVYGRNLTNEKYRVGELPVADLWTFASFGAPRTLGVEAGYTFKR